VSGTLTTNTGRIGGDRIEQLVVSGGRVRQLTPLECERLQGFSDHYTEGFNDNQRYKMLGNTMPVPVIRWIGERILTNEK
jgi:DNA (cytosine-5)-methyltransferase 1